MSKRSEAAEAHDEPVRRVSGPVDHRRLAGIRRWMRGASRDDLARLIERDSGALRAISSVARVLCETVEDFDAAKGSVSVRFEPRLALSNPWKHLHGGFVAAALDEATALAASLYVGPRNFGGTLSNSVSYIRPVQLAPFTVEAHVVERSINFLTVQSSLYEGQEGCRARSLSIIAVRTGETDPR